MNQQKRSKRMLNTIIFSLFFKYTDIKQLEIAVEAKAELVTLAQTDAWQRGISVDSIPAVKFGK